jgi:Zn-dependent protease
MTHVIIALLFGIIAMLIHEAGHFLAAEIWGIKTKGVRLTVLGLAVVRERGPWFHSLIVSLAGPLMNVAVGLATWPGLFAQANLFIGLFQLLPISASDGTHALECVAAMRDIRANKRKRAGFVDETELAMLLRTMQEHPMEHFYYPAKTHADAEKVFERVLHAGGDTSRLTVFTEEALTGRKA